MTCLTKEGRNNSLSYIRAIGCIGVVLLHAVFTGNMLFLDSLNANQNLEAQIIENLMMWAVPSFIMVTGALSLEPNKKIPLKKLFGKNIFKIIKSIVFFTIVYSIFDMAMNGEGFTSAGVMLGISNILTGDGWAHMWYMYMLIGIYLLMPVYKLVTDNGSNRILKYFIAVYIIFVAIIPLFQVFNLKCGFYIHERNIYPCYLFLGYAINKEIIELDKRKSVIMILVSAIAVGTLTIVGFRNDIQNISLMWGYSSVLVVIGSAGIFGFIDNIESSKPGLFGRFLIKLDSCSFGIYLIHMIFLRLIMTHLNINPFEYGGIWAFLPVTVFVVAISWIITIVMKRIPILRSFI